MPRTATLTRKTNETNIAVSLDLDPTPGSAPGSTPGSVLFKPRAEERSDEAPDQPAIATGVGFFDHMLTHVAKHGRINLHATCTGDTHIDDHHTVEDVGIALGQALDQALGDKRGIERYGFANVPMDETLARVALDLSGRPALVFHVNWTTYGIEPPAIAGERIGTFDVQLVKEFFNAVVNNAKMNLHIEVPWGDNNHHIAEAIFKAFGRSLREAIAVTSHEVPSTKGVL